MIILPTKGRPDNLKRFITNYYATGASLPIHIILVRDDAYRYNDVVIPPHWKKITAPAGSRLGDIFTLIFKNFPNEPFYGMVADDVVPETAMWDIILRDSCVPNKISWGADGIQDKNLPVHPFIGGDLVRELGWWSAPGLKHWYVDNVWKVLTELLDVGVYLPQLKMTHHHFTNGLARKDRTYDEQPSHSQDESTFRHFLVNDLPGIIDKIKNKHCKSLTL